MEVIKCPKCGKEGLHESRVYNDMPNSRQVQGMVCGRCGHWSKVRYVPIYPADEQRLRKSRY